MPPQVGKAGDGPRPVINNAGEGVEEIKSHGAEKKSAEQQKEVSKNESAAPHRASAKEASNKKAELSAGAAAQKTTLNRLVITGTSGNDRIRVSKAKGSAGKLGLIEVTVNRSKQYLTKQEANRLVIKAGAGNDRIVIDSNVKQRIRVDKGSGNDVIIGSGVDDNLEAGEAPASSDIDRP